MDILPTNTFSHELSLLDPTVLQIINKYQDSLVLRKEELIKSLQTNVWGLVTQLSCPPTSAIRKIAATLLLKHRALKRAANPSGRQALKDELTELSAREQLHATLPNICQLLQRMKDRAHLEECKPSLETRQISNKCKELSATAVTDELREALESEFQLLGVDHIKTRLNPKSVRGKIFHRLVLDLPSSTNMEEVLSEGEQRAIALGSFFAELSASNHSCGIVLDDPVSSLDNFRKQLVAKRLVSEATVRQVIVFTHDTSFLALMQEEIEEHKTPHSISYLEWDDGAPGLVRDGLPWDQMKYLDRKDKLEKKQRELAKQWMTYPNDELKSDMRHQYSLLRATIERVIQDILFNGVIERYRDWIKVGRLSGVIGFNYDEFEAIEKLYKKCCSVTSSHDPSSAKDAPTPTPIDLKRDISELTEIVSMIQNRKKSK